MIIARNRLLLLLLGFEQPHEKKNNFNNKSK